jgi:hypothetical protein
MDITTSGDVAATIGISYLLPTYASELRTRADPPISEQTGSNVK